MIYNSEHRVKLDGANHWCGYCGKQLNGATAYDASERIVPKDGDYSVCAYCGACGFSKLRLRHEPSDPAA